LRYLGLALTVLLALLQYPLWLGHGGVLDLVKLRHSIAEQHAMIAQVRERTEALRADVLDLKDGLRAVEERARSELGMVRRGETFFQIVGGSDASSASGGKG